jgi:hypothetical protein
MVRRTDKTAPIVAELGRPETAQETADRKAAAAQKRRSHQTALNLVLSLAACLAVVLLLVLVVVRPDVSESPDVDYAQVAADAQPGIAAPLATPQLPDDWTANAARLDTKNPDGVTSWYIGFVTPGKQYIGMRQGVDANATWIANRLDNARPTGTSTIAGTTWNVYDRRSERDPGNLAFAMTTVSGSSSYVLYGTAKTDEFRALAIALASELDK